MTYYHKITTPKRARIALLEAAKEPLILLSSYKEIVEIRKQKKQIIAELKVELNGLSALVRKLDKILPEKELKIEIRKNEEKAFKADHSKKSSKKKSSKKEKTMTEVDRLAYTLRKIEEKLAELKQ